MRLFLLHRIRESNIGGSGVLDKSTVYGFRPRPLVPLANVSDAAT